MVQDFYGLKMSDFSLGMPSRDRFTEAYFFYSRVYVDFLSSKIVIASLEGFIVSSQTILVHEILKSLYLTLIKKRTIGKSTPKNL